MLFKFPKLPRITSLGFEVKSSAVNGHLATSGFKLKAVAALQSLQWEGVCWQQMHWWCSPALAGVPRSVWGFLAAPLLSQPSCFSNEGADPTSSNLLTVSFELLCQTRTCFSLLETTAVHQKSCEPAGELTETPMLVSGLLPYADLTRTS